MMCILQWDNMTETGRTGTWEDRTGQGHLCAVCCGVYALPPRPPCLHDRPALLPAVTLPTCLPTLFPSVCVCGLCLPHAPFPHPPLCPCALCACLLPLPHYASLLCPLAVPALWGLKRHPQQPPSPFLPLPCAYTPLIPAYPTPEPRGDIWETRTFKIWRKKKSERWDCKTDGGGGGRWWWWWFDMCCGGTFVVFWWTEEDVGRYSSQERKGSPCASRIIH